MSGRTCQFCGKPLSRIWAGGGDYCSREHRNQHRLRLGMDRLQEANKVASLMRRRENLKPIAALHPVVASVMENRSLPAAKLAVSRSAALAFKPVPAALPALRVVRSSAGCLPPKARGSAGESCPRPLDPKSIRPRLGVPAIPRAPRIVRSTGSLQQAKMAIPRHSVAPRKGDRRTLETLQPSTRNPVLSGSMVRRKPAIASPFKQACRARFLAASATAGRDLRVSQSQGFRPSILRVCPVALALGSRSKLTWNDSPRKLELAREFPAPEPAITNPSPVAREPRYPSAPGPSRGETAHWPAVRSLKMEEAAPCGPMQAAVRVSQVGWDTTPPEESLHCAWYLSAPAITLGYSKEPHRAPSAESARSPVLADVRLEENFASGCSNWVGEVADWRLDAAGARTGSLALFTPSLELIDYEMEFLVRVENRSVVWVFRAVDTNDYYRAALRITPEGGHEFIRSAVIAGVAEPAIGSPVSLPNNARTALAVRTSVKNKDFAVFVEGQAVDRWTDDRLPIGGVGFGSAPDDRARLYWLRLTYSGSPGMKDVKR